MHLQQAVRVSTRVLFRENLHAGALGAVPSNPSPVLPGSPSSSTLRGKQKDLLQTNSRASLDAPSIGSGSASHSSVREFAGAQCVAFHPHRPVVYLSVDNSVFGFDISTKGLIGHVSIDDRHMITHLEVSSTHPLLLATTDEGFVYVWEQSRYA